MVIDFHTHVFPPHVKRDRAKYVASDPCFAALYSDERAELATADELVAAMDKDGVDMSVALNIGWTTHELCVETNDYIMESVARYPDRLVGFCTVQPKCGEAAAAEIERCVKGGIKGVGELRPDVQLGDLGGERDIWAPVMEVVSKSGLIVLFHSSEPVGHQYPGKGTVTPELLYPLISGYPGVPIVLAHWGGGMPFYAFMPEVKHALKDVYYDTAASPYLYTPDIYWRAADIVGADRILFGSDFPLMRQSRPLKEIGALSLGKETEALVLGGNAARLLGLAGGV